MRAATTRRGRAEIERLLAAHLQASTFIERSPLAGLLTTSLSIPLTGRVMGHYQLGHLLGIGGMGVVYAARDLELERDVALKIVNSDAADAQVRLRREAQRASQLNHPDSCIVHEVGTSDGITYFVMEHVDGETLADLIARHTLPLESALKYGSQIADALAHAHDHGVIHRDLKSANVMVTRDGRIKILDFGVECGAPAARVSDLSQSTKSLARDEPSAGTLPYMAPELFRAEPADIRSDIWALGVVLYKMATGQRPFNSATGFEISAARGRIALGRQVLASALEQAPPANSSARAKGLMASSMLARFAGEHARALTDAQASVSLYEAMQGADAADLAFALFQRATARVNLAEGGGALARIWSAASICHSASAVARCLASASTCSASSRAARPTQTALHGIWRAPSHDSSKRRRPPAR